MAKAVLRLFDTLEDKMRYTKKQIENTYGLIIIKDGNKWTVYDRETYYRFGDAKTLKELVMNIPCWQAEWLNNN